MALIGLISNGLARDRQASRGKGTNQQRRYTLVADEYRSISKALPSAKDSIGASEILLQLLTQGRKAGIVVLVAAHADTVKALGIEGEGDLRTSFDWIVYLGGMAVKKLPAAAQMERSAVAYHPERDEYYLVDVGSVSPSPVQRRQSARVDDTAMLAGLLTGSHRRATLGATPD